MSKINPSFLQRAELAKRVHDELLEETSSFEGELGMQLAYLLGAILNGEPIDGTPEVLSPDVLRTFEAAFPADHPVWAHIEREDEGG